MLMRDGERERCVRERAIGLGGNLINNLTARRAFGAWGFGEL